MKHLILAILLVLASTKTIAGYLDGYPIALFDQKEFNCLVRNIYYESRGEPIKGQEAVAVVTINRTVASEHKSICKTVYAPYQFSWTRMKNLRVLDANAWSNATDIAYRTLTGNHSLGIFNATHFHATYINPNWGLKRLRKIGSHIFYE